MNLKDTKTFYLYQFFSIAFLLLTTKYLNVHDIINIGGQMDAISYIEISKYFPKLPTENDIILQNVAQRFIIPYVAGFFSNIFVVDLLIVFRVFTALFLIFYIFLITFIADKLKLNLRESILLFSLLLLNPYIARYHLFNPIQSHDMLFFCLCALFAYSVIMNKFILNIFVTVITIFLRQTSIALFCASLIHLTIHKKKKIIIFLCLSYFISLYTITNVGKYISTNSFPIGTAYGIFLYDFTQINKLVRFVLIPFVSFSPLFIFFLSERNKDINIKTILILLIPCIMMIGQPYLGGPTYSTSNVVRISTLCYPILTILMFYSFNLRKILMNNLIFFLLICCLFFWSMHPTFSIFKFFGIFRFYNY